MKIFDILVAVQLLGMLVAQAILGYKAGCEIALARASNPRQPIMVGIDGYGTAWRCLVWPALIVALVVEKVMMQKMIKSITFNQGEAILKRPSTK